LTVAKSLTGIKEVDFTYENSPIKIIANRNHPEIELAGTKIGPFEEGREYDIKYWIAHELERAGIIHILPEEQLDLRKLNNIHWKESGIVHAKQLSSLEADFYPKLRRYLAGLKRSAIGGNTEKTFEYQKASRMAQDIVNCRLQKIVSLASSPEQNNLTLKDMATEEHILYENLHTFIRDWKGSILKETEE
jgi:hypothetical protein